MPNPQANYLTGYSNNIPSENNDVKLPSAQEVEQAIKNDGKKKIHLSEKVSGGYILINNGYCQNYGFILFLTPKGKIVCGACDWIK